jgi:hypothetical protein
MATVIADPGSGWYVKNASGTLIGPVGDVPTVDVWYWVELKITFHASTGSAELRVNGATLGSVSSVNTSPSSKTTVDTAIIGLGPSNQVNHAVADDLVIMDGTGSQMNDFIGDVWVQYLTPSSDVTINLDGSDGNQTDNYNLVRETPPSSTSYVGGSTAGDLDYYGMPNLSTSATWTVFGAQIWSKLGKESGGDAFGRVLAQSSGSTQVGDSVGLSTSYLYQSLTLPTAPDGSTWTPSLINDLELGFEVRAST